MLRNVFRLRPDSNIKIIYHFLITDNECMCLGKAEFFGQICAH